MDRVYIVGLDHEELGSDFVAGEMDKRLEYGSISPLLEKWKL